MMTLRTIPAIQRAALLGLALGLIAPLAHADTTQAIADWQALDQAYISADADPGFKTRLKGSSSNPQSLVDFKAALDAGEPLRRTALRAATHFESTYGTDLRTLDKQFKDQIGGSKAYNNARRESKIKRSPASTLRAIKNRQKNIARQKVSAQKRAASQLKMLATRLKGLHQMHEDQADGIRDQGNLVLATINNITTAPYPDIATQHAALQANYNEKTEAFKQRHIEDENNGVDEDDYLDAYHAQIPAEPVEDDGEDGQAEFDNALARNGTERLSHSPQYRGKDSASTIAKEAIRLYNDLAARSGTNGFTAVNAYVASGWGISDRNILKEITGYSVRVNLVTTRSPEQEADVSRVILCILHTREFKGVQPELPISHIGYCDYADKRYVRLSTNR